MLPLPDLLHLEPRDTLDHRLVSELLEVAFLGWDPGTNLDEVLSAGEVAPSNFHGDLFAEDLYLDELVEGCLRISVDGRTYPVHKPFLRRLLSSPPTDLAAVRFRQGILAELAAETGLAGKARELYKNLFGLLSLFKAPRAGEKVDITPYRLEVLEQARWVIDHMATDFAGARSGLVRLAEAGRAIQDSPEYRTLTALLDYEGHLAGLTLAVRVGADGEIRRLAVREVAENSANTFYHGPLRRAWDRLSLLARGYPVSGKEVVSRLILDVYLKIAPALRGLLQILGHLEVYLASLSFAAWAEEHGHPCSLPHLSADARFELRDLFNPLLLAHDGFAVPCDLETAASPAILVVTGPNSGGKTRLLQAVGLAQILAQSGLYAPVREARLPLFRGLFASLLNREDPYQSEGRLGTELLRIRTLFETVGGGSLILLDELCSGTNPSEAVEIFSMVLELLTELSPVAFITTHFLDFAQTLAARPPVPGLAFLRVETDDQNRSTYQFRPGVADTSLAAGTARRLGVTFEELQELVERRKRLEGPRPRAS